MDWLPSFQTLPFRAVGLLGQQLWQAARMGRWRGGFSSREALWRGQLGTAPPPVLPFQPGVGTEAARDSLSLGAGYSCFESSGVMGVGGRG